MDTIVVKNLKKEYKIAQKEKGLAGAVKNLFVRKYEILRAVDDISFTIPKGEITAFIGPNGAGKSTICKMLTGLYQPDSGEIYFMGRKVVN